MFCILGYASPLTEIALTVERVFRDRLFAP